MSHFEDINLQVRWECCGKPASLEELDTLEFDAPFVHDPCPYQPEPPKFSYWRWLFCLPQRRIPKDWKEMWD